MTMSSSLSPYTGSLRINTPTEITLHVVVCYLFEAPTISKMVENVAAGSSVRVFQTSVLHSCQAFVVRPRLLSANPVLVMSVSIHSIN